MSTRVRKGNKVLTVADDAVERYIGQGYSVIDETGAIVTKAMPVGNNQLKAEYIRMSDTIKSLEAEVKQLKSTNEYLDQENKRLTKELTTLKSAPISSEGKTTRKRKQASEDKEVAE